MRKEFAKYVLNKMNEDKNIVLITADLGYGLWESVQEKFPDRYYNVGSAEQLMIGMAAGFAMEKKLPICYSITPFLLYRPFEFIRNFMQFDQLPIILAGSGRDKDYGNLGFTHHAEEDLDVLRPLFNIRTYKPQLGPEFKHDMKRIFELREPCYINLTR